MWYTRMLNIGFQDKEITMAGKQDPYPLLHPKQLDISFLLLQAPTCPPQLHCHHWTPSHPESAVSIYTQHTAWNTGIHTAHSVVTHPALPPQRLHYLPSSDSLSTNSPLGSDHTEPSVTFQASPRSTSPSQSLRNAIKASQLYIIFVQRLAWKKKTPNIRMDFYLLWASSRT